MAEPLAYGLLRAAEHCAWHLELRDSYTPDDPDWLDWKAGVRFDPADRWPDWSDLVRATVARGVDVHRLRIVSEPVTEYMRFEYDVTDAHNIAAGEGVRWLPRHLASGLLVPVEDHWVFGQPDDHSTVSGDLPCPYLRHRLAPGRPGRLSAFAWVNSARTPG